MANVAVTCVIGCAALLLSSSVACQGGKHGPAIVFDSTRFDFGAALEGRVLTHAFTFTNTGDRTLQISQVVSRCTCTVARAVPSSVPPGQRGTVEVMFNSEGFSGATAESVDVRSNASTQTVRLTITADVEQRLDYEPHYIKLVCDDPAASAQRVRFVGRLARDIHPTVSSIETLPSSGEVVRAKTFRELVDGVESTGIDLSLEGPVRTAGSGTVVVSTGLKAPHQVEIRFAWGESTKLSHR